MHLGFGLRLGAFSRGGGGVFAAPTIQVSRTEAVAPAAVVFSATNPSYDSDAGFYDIDYTWDFDDEGAVFVNHDSGAPYENNANFARGPVVGHTWETAGTKTVTCTARHMDGRVETSTVEITVTDPESVSWGRDVIVAFDADFTGLPTGTHQVSDLASLVALVNTYTGSVRCRFKAGATYELGVGLDPRNHTISWWGRVGEGADPILQMTAGTAAQSGSFLSFLDVEHAYVSNLKFDGRYDPVTGVATHGRVDAINASFNSDGSSITVHKVETYGVMTAIYPLGGTTQFVDGIRQLYVSDCLIRDWGDYGVLVDSMEWLGIYGGSIKQDTEVVSFDEKLGDVTPNSPDHGPARLTSNGNMAMHHISLRSHNGWSPPPDGGHHQPCLRLIREEEDLPWGGHRWNVSDAMMEGGSFGGLILYGRTNSNKVISGQLGRLLIDSVYGLADEQTMHFMYVEYGKLDVRNCVMVKPDLENGVLGLPAFNGIVQMFSDVSDIAASVGSAPIRLYNNTFVQLQGAVETSPASLAVFEDSGAEHNLLDENNIVQALSVPNSASFTDWSPLDDADFYRPEAGSDAVGAATTGRVAIRDFTGALRSSPTSIGAHDGPPASAMAADAAAMFWYNSDSVVLSGSDVTSWDDVTGNGYDLAINPTSLSDPTWDAVNSRVELNGSQALSSSLAVGPISTELVDNSGSVAIFIVCEIPRIVAASGSVVMNIFGEFGGSSANQATRLYIVQDGSGANDGSLDTIVMAQRGDFSALTLSATARSDSKVLLEFRISQASGALLRDNTSLDTDTPNTANFPTDTTTSLTIGARGQAGTSTLERMTGYLYEIFGTTDTTSENLNAVREELAAKHGITLA